MAKHFQFVWWGLGAWPFRIIKHGPMPMLGAGAGSVYRWRLVLGPLEIRRWGKWGPK